MAQVIMGNASAITVPRNERSAIRRFYCDVLGGRIVKEDNEKDICRLEKEFYIVFRYGDDRDESEFLRSPRAQCFQLLPISEDQAYYKGTRHGPNAAQEEEAEVRKEKALSDLALMHLRNQSN